MTPGFVNYKKGALDSQPQVIKFTSCLPMVGGSLRLLPPLKLIAIYSWNIVESGAKHNISNQIIIYENLYFDWMISFYYFWTVLLTTGDYTWWRELYQFQTISHEHYNCGIYFFALFFYIFFGKIYLR
jgi:hypothetical protein